MNVNGAKWIRREKRLAIYLRDGLACVWCGQSVEDGARLTLDHLLPRANGGHNEATNLVTSCDRCNRSRGTRSVADFASAVAEYLDHDVQAEDIVAHVQGTAVRLLDIGSAKALISRRGSFTAALYG